MLIVVDVDGDGRFEHWVQFDDDARTEALDELQRRWFRALAPVDREAAKVLGAWVGATAAWDIDRLDQLLAHDFEGYEATAYAEWAGKSLPTLFHWNRVAITVGSSNIVPAANYSGKDAVAVGVTRRP